MVRYGRFVHFNQWKNCPLHLSTEQITNPLLILRLFFDDDWLPGHLERLKEWRRCVLKDEYYKGQKNSPAELLYFHRLNIRLVEAAYLLKGSKKPKFSPLTDEQETWRDYPVNLSDAELINPLLVLSEFFEDYTLPQYREQLYEWLEYGLSAKAANEFIETDDLISVYENLQKLYSVAWLMHQRTAYETIEEIADITNMNTSSDVQVYQLDNEIKPEQTELISSLVSIIRHKVTTVQAIIYLGKNLHQSGKLFLLVLTAGTEQRQAISLSSPLEESCQKAGEVTVLVHYSAAMIKGVQDHNLFFNTAVNSPVIYLSGDLFLPVRQSVSSQDLPANWERWHIQGKDFLKGAAFYLQLEAYGPALFLLHQCVESLLVAVIRAVLGYHINVHNLTKLLSITQMFTDDIASVFNLEQPESKYRFTLLKDAYINVRYRDNYRPDGKSIDALYRIVMRFVAVTESVYAKHTIINSL
jgi:HEPN domain-containing protein